MLRRTTGALAGVLLLLLGACSGDDDIADDSPDDSGEESSQEGAEWPTAGLDLENSRAVSDAAITSATVVELSERWRADLEGAGPLSTVPIVVDDTVYLSSGTGAVFAIDLATGDQVWSSEPTGFNIGPFGVAVDEERVYGLDGSDGVVALDRDDGTEVWSTDVTATETTGIDIQPVVVDGLVLVSSVPVSTDGIYAPGDRGVIQALDAESGEVAWSFDTVEGDLWGQPEINSGGGAWYPPAVDESRSLVYFGVANPAPFPGIEGWPNGTSRPGDNLYTNSVVALDLQTGALEWFHQVIPHDLLDRDQVHTIYAEDLDLVVSAGKSGVLVGLDPDEGVERWRVEVGLHQNDDLTELDGPTEVAPGTYGGVLTPPAYADGVVYAPVVNAPVTLLPDETAYFGAELGKLDGEVAAVDASDGSLLWSTEVPGDPLGGATVVGDLVVTVLLDGTVVFLDRDGGAIIHTMDAGGGTNGWMAALDDQLLIPIGMGDPPSLLSLSLDG